VAAGAAAGAAFFADVGFLAALGFLAAGFLAAVGFLVAGFYKASARQQPRHGRAPRM